MSVMIIHETFLSFISANYFLITSPKEDQLIWSSVLFTLLEGHKI